MLGMPKGTMLEKLTFGDLIKASDSIIANADALKVLISLRVLIVISYESMFSGS